jgi:thioredoxin reductase (NADPH)
VGAGVFYGASGSEARAMAGEDVCVVGGANSAGQAALHLARYASTVTLVVRGDSLDKSMSQYLIEEIGATGTIVVRPGTRVVGGGGQGRLDHIILEAADGAQESLTTSAVFVLIGAHPHTDWLPAAIARDEHGFVLVGADAAASGSWPLERPPLQLETSMPGVFAVGDVRRGSVKRVASAVGDGAVVVQLVHQFLGAS